MSRSMRSGSVTAVVALLVAGLVLPVGAAFAATTTKTAKDVIALEEAWYYRYRQPLEPVPQAPKEAGPLPTQQDNVEAQVRQRSNPYEAETLHVGINAGNPEARTVLYWDPFSLADGGLATIVGGSVKLPLVDTRGVRNAENAQMIACMNVDLPTSDLAGEWKEQPKYDCKTSVPVKLVKDSDPLTWTVNLDPFGKKWKADPTTYAGIAVVEDPKAAESPDSSTWHVAFAGQYNEKPDVEKVTADLTYEVEEFDFDFEPPKVPEIEPPPAEDFETGGGGFNDDAGFGEDNTVAAPGSGGGGFSAPADSGPALTGGSSAAPGVGGPAPAADSGPAPVAAEQPQAQQPVAAAPVNEQKGIKNPFGYWLLPVLGLILAGALGWSLSNPVELVNVREGAVSRLMRARRA